jgi:hypothetical protein
LTSPLNTPTAAGLALVAPTATDPSILRLTSGTGGNNTGQQAQESNDWGTTAWARYFPRVGASGESDNIHWYCSFRVSEATNDNFIIGLAPVSATLLTAGSAFNTATFIGVQKLAAGTTMNGIIRVASVNTSTIALTTAFAANTWYDLEFRVISNATAANSSIEWWLNGVRSTATLAMPAAALAPSIAITGADGTTRTMDFRAIACCQEVR